MTEWADTNCRAVLDASPDAMFVVNRAGEIVAANLQAEKLSGLLREQLIGMVVESLLPVRFRERHRWHRENFLANPEARFMQVPEIVALRSDGSEFPADVSLSRLTIRSEAFTVSAIRDTTDRVRVEELKRSEAILRESEERFRSLADSAPVLIWQSGKGKLCTYFNKPWLDFTGRSMEEELGNGWAEGIHPEDLHTCLDTYTQSFDRRDEFRMEYRLRRHDGEYRWVLDIGVPRFNQDRSFTGYIGIAVDVTEQKQAEQRLRESEQRFRLAVQAGNMYSFEWDVTTDVVLRSPEHVRVLGVTEPLRFSHQQFVDTIHPDDLPTFSATIAGLTPECPTAEVTYRVPGSDGAFVWLKSNGRAFFDEEGKMLRVIGMVADVTNQKLTEEALRASEGRLRLAQQAARIGTFERDVRTGRVTWAEGLESLYGLPPGSVDGKTPAFFNHLVHPADRERVAHFIQEALKTGQPTEGEWRAMWPDGSVHWIAGRWQVLMDDSGVPSRVVGVNMDVTERKLAEQSLKDMTRKLIESQEQERSRIGRELHDDINQRLAMLALELEQPHDSSEFQNRVQRFREELRQISDDVQALSHDLHSTKLEYLGVVAGMKSWCKEFAERQKMDVDFKSDVRSLPSLEVGHSLFRVLQEALHNAFKHSGVKTIEVQLREDSGEIHLIVRDLGRGFDVEAALHGKGLGLTSMRERVRLMNGTIVIDSKPMGGTTIHVRVPFGSERSSQREAV